MTQPTTAVRRDVLGNRLKLHWVWIGFGFFIIGLVIYVGLRSQNYDFNGFIETIAIEEGGASLFSPNHLVYRPIIAFFYSLMQSAGYVGLSLPIAQVVTAVSASIGLALFFWWIRQIVDKPLIAVIATIGFGTSWAYWVFSIDVFYITPAATAVLAALLILTNMVKRDDWAVSRVLLLAFFTALGILLWQANIFFVPVVIGVLAVHHLPNWSRLIQTILLFVIVMGLLVGGIYLLSSLVVLQDTWSVDAFLEWILGYGGASLEIWGQLDISRVGPAAFSAVSSIVPLWEGMALSELLAGQFVADKVLPQLSLLALVLIFAVPAIVFLLRPKSVSIAWRPLLMLAIGYAIYMPFIIWWDPFEPKWFVVPSIAFWGIAAILWDTVMPGRWGSLLGLSVLVITLANLTAAILPRSSQPDARLLIADCVAAEMAPNDLFIETDWSWSPYLDYFFERSTVSIIHYAGIFTEEALLIQLQEDIRATEAAGGRVYIRDIQTMSEDDLNWFAEISQFDRAFWTDFRTTPAFTCGDVSVAHLVDVIPPP